MLTNGLPVGLQSYFSVFRDGVRLEIYLQHSVLSPDELV